jgi:hypothetical protein
MNSRWYRRTICCPLSAVIIVPVNPALIPCSHMIFCDRPSYSRIYNISRQISFLFAFNSGDSLYGTRLATKNLRSILCKTRNIIVIGMKKSLAIFRHEVWGFLFKQRETASERLLLEGFLGRSPSSTDILLLRKRLAHVSTVRWQRTSLPYPRLSFAWIAMSDSLWSTSQRIMDLLLTSMRDCLVGKSMPQPHMLRSRVCLSWQYISTVCSLRKAK